jgi:hypothetical protein
MPHQATRDALPTAAEGIVFGIDCSPSTWLEASAAAAAAAPSARARHCAASARSASTWRRSARPASACALASWSLAARRRSYSVVRLDSTDSKMGPTASKATSGGAAPAAAAGGGGSGVAGTPMRLFSMCVQERMR